MDMFNRADRRSSYLDFDASISEVAPIPPTKNQAVHNSRTLLTELVLPIAKMMQIVGRGAKCRLQIQPTCCSSAASSCSD